MEEVLLGRDVPLCKHMVKLLPQDQQMGLLQELAEHHKIYLEERPKESSEALAVVIHPEEEAQSQEET